MQTTLTEVFLLSVLALVIKQRLWSVTQVQLTSQLSQSWAGYLKILLYQGMSASILAAEPVDNDPHVLNKDINTRIVLSFNLFDLEVPWSLWSQSPSSLGYLENLCGFLRAGNSADRRTHRRQLSSLFLTLTTASLFPRAEGNRM